MQINSCSLLLNLFLKQAYACLADTLTVEINNVICIIAKYARRLIFLENYLISIGKNLYCVLLLYIQHFSDLYRENYSSQLIDLSDYTGRFQSVLPPIVFATIAVLPQYKLIIHKKASNVNSFLHFFSKKTKNLFKLEHICVDKLVSLYQRSGFYGF